MAHMPSLPTELWLEIAIHLEQKDQVPLLLLNHSFHALYSPVLYRRVIIKGPDEYIGDITEDITRGEFESKFTPAGPVAARLLQRLESSEETRIWVQSCQITSFRSLSAWVLWDGNPNLDSPMSRGFQTLMWNIFILIGSLPSLKSVKLIRAEIPLESLYHICSRPHLSLSITVIGVSFFERSEVEPDTPFTMAKFYSTASQLRHAMHSFTILTLGCSLKELALGREVDTHLRKFYQAHMDYPGISLPRLETLAISWILTEYLPFFSSTPNLTELNLRGMTRTSLGNGPLDPSFLPKLQKFYGHNCFIPFFVTGRPVHTVATWSSTGSGSSVFLGHDDNVVLEDMAPRFGSKVDVRILTWQNCTSTRGLLLYLVAHNSKITRLDLTPTIPFSKDELHARLKYATQLTELHTLDIQCLEHVPSENTMAWEREQCEWLQKDGSSSLTSISFSTLVEWNWERGSSVWVPSGAGTLVYNLDKVGAISWNGIRST